MSHSADKKDKRIKNTNETLIDALTVLLEHQNFARITVKDLCNEAIVSRPTFYAHFADKYDLLAYWLKSVQIDFLINSKIESYDAMEKSVNQLVKEHKKLIKNIMEDANEETSELLCKWIIYNVDKSSTNDGMRKSTKYIVQSKFYAGGVIFYLMWQVKNNFPPNTPTMNIYLYEIIKMFHDLISETDFKI